MKRLTDWLTREVRRHARAPRLEQALLTDRAGAYVFYRLQFMWLRVFVRCAVHFLELTLLATAVPDDWLAIFIGYRTSTGVASSLYWGALEQLRETVRAHIKRRHFGSARLAIHNWLRVSALLGVLGLGAVGVWIATAPSEFAGFTVFDLFGIACFVRLAFDLWARALHSGIFATRRVYRPLWSLLLPDLIEFALLVVLFPPFSLLAFVAMVVVGGVVRIGLANHYTRRAYRGSRLAPPTLREALVARNTLSRRDLGAALKFGLSNATSQLDGLIVLLLLWAARAGQGAEFAGVYYVLRPVMAVAHGWARTFYFDFKRIESSPALFRRRFRALLTRTAFVLAVAAALMVLLVAALLSRGVPSASMLCLVPFFAARSLMSVRQVEAFTAGTHAALLRASAVLVIALTLVAWLTRSEVAVMLVGSALILVTAYVLPTAGDRPTVSVVTGLPRFLARLHRETVPVRLSVLCVDRHVSTAARLVRQLATVVEHGSVTRFGRSHVLVFERVEGAALRDAHDVVRVCAGTVATYRAADGERGDAALDKAMEQGALPESLAAMLRDDTNANLVEAYRSAHPHGTVIDAAGGRVSSGHMLGPRELRAVMHAIAIQAGGGHERPSDKVDVMVYAPGGEPETIFITPRTSRPSLALRKLIEAVTLQASLRDHRAREAGRRDSARAVMSQPRA